MTHLNVKGFQETLNESMCGPASLKIVLGYFGVEKEEKELADVMGTTDLGVNDKSIKAAAESYGYTVTIKNESNFDDIQSWLEKDVPPLVNWFTRGRSDYSDSVVSDGHYSVVSGLDEHYVYLQDPEIGMIRTIDRSDFMKVWFDFEGETIKPDELIIRQLIAIYR